jgi:hypothetical protein
MKRKRLVILTFTIVCLVILGVVVATLVPKHSNNVTPIPKTTTVTPKVTTVTTVAPVTPIPTSTPKPRNVVMAERLEKVINATFERVPEWRIEETKRCFKEYPWVAVVWDHTNRTERKIMDKVVLPNLNRTIIYDLFGLFGCDLNEEAVNDKHPEDVECAVLAKELNLTSYLRNHGFPVMILHFPSHNPEFVIIDGSNITKEFPKYVPLIKEYWAKYYGNKSKQ